MKKYSIEIGCKKFSVLGEKNCIWLSIDNTKRTIFRVLILLLAVHFSLSTQAQSSELSTDARISLLTCSRGDELYSCFGHSGIRVTDPQLHLDIVFNYGTFDFDQPNFYLNFGRGHMIYMMGVDRFSDFYQQYIYEQRDIYEQEFQLPLADKQRIFNFLLINAKEENRNYHYDFLFDNCATRIRDVFEKNLTTHMRIDYSSFDKNLSFRDLIDEYSSDKPWENFGMNLLIGMPVDAKATPSQQTFLPDYLSRAFDNAYLIQNNGTEQKMCKKQEIILHAKPSESTATNGFSITPFLVFFSLLILISIYTFIELRNGFYFYPLDAVLFFVVGLLGTLFLVMWFGTEHTTTARNLNLIWALPTHLIFCFTLLNSKKISWKKNYFLGTLIINLLFIALYRFLPQDIQLPMVFISAIIAVRAYRIFKTQNN